MFRVESYDQTKKKNYELVVKQLKGLLEGETNRIANFSNASALLNQFLDNVNWVGFYFPDGDDELVLGPFQGLPACVRIGMGKGVCGTAAKERKTIRVHDVHEFSGHIACDSASNSEIVIPLVKGNEFIGLLDIDSPSTDRFDETDEWGLQQFAAELIHHL